jgi:hypothetical protein
MSQNKVDFRGMSDHEFDEWFDKKTMKHVPHFTRLWFDLMGWMTVIGALEYMRERTNDIAVWIALGISVLLLLIFIEIPIAIFFKKRGKSRSEKLLAEAFGFLLTLFLLVLLRAVVTEIISINVQ